MLNRVAGILRSVCAAAAISLLLSSPVGGQTLQGCLLRDAADGRLDSFEFVEACLIAGGVEDECELEGWVNVYKEREEKILARLSQAASQRLTEALHAELRREFLRGNYDPSASDLRGPLGGRAYNCLSSVALMYSLARAAGVRAEICLAPGHVNLVLNAAGQTPVVVEPTAISTPARTVSADTPPSGRVLTPVELLGKFYYNRGVELLRSEEYSEGLRLLAISMRLDGEDLNAKTNFLAGINNWATAHFAAGNLQRASELVALGLHMDADFAPLRANQLLIRGKLGLQ